MKDNLTTEKKSREDLKAMLENARTSVKVGGTYYHYKHPDQLYTLTDVVIIEASEEVGICYRAEYPELKGVVFMRPISDFHAEVEKDGVKSKRFTLVE